MQLRANDVSEVSTRIVLVPRELECEVAPVWPVTHNNFVMAVFAARYECDGIVEPQLPYDAMCDFPHLSRSVVTTDRRKQEAGQASQGGSTGEVTTFAAFSATWRRFGDGR